MDDALQRYKSGNSCQEPPILYISTFPQGIYINNLYKRAFLYYISPCHCPTLAWYPAFSPGWGHGGLTNTISPLASMEGMKNHQRHVTAIPSYNLISVASHARQRADRGTGHRQTQESNTCWNLITAWGCHIICCRKHNIVCRHEGNRVPVPRPPYSPRSPDEAHSLAGTVAHIPLCTGSCHGNCVGRPARELPGPF